jgi:hypothetical protein
MKKIRSLVVSSAVAALLLSAGCGGGGGSPTPPAAATTATLTLTSSGTLPAGTQIGGINVTVTIPTTVSVKATPNKVNPSQVTYSGAVTASGVALSTDALTLAALTSPTTVNVQLTNPHGFGVGEFAKIMFDIASGSEVVPGEFSAGSFVAVDLNGAPISGLTASLEAVIQ